MKFPEITDPSSPQCFKVLREDKGPPGAALSFTLFSLVNRTCLES